MKKILTIALTLLLTLCLVSSMSIAAFAAEEATEAPAATEQPVVTEAPVVEPTAAPAVDPEPSGGDIPGLDPGDVGTCAAITIICFLVGLAVKASPLDDKWIPIIVGAVGGVIGALALYLMPGFPAEDIITAIGVGVLSGLAAVGIHQIGKQLSGN